MTTNLFGTRSDHAKAIEAQKKRVNKTFASGWKSAEKEIKKHKG